MSTLDGGLQGGHLGLASRAPACERISPGVPFVCPDALPVPQEFLEGTQHQIAEASRIFNRNLDMFNGSTGIRDDCLANLVDEDTGLLEGTVPDVLDEPRLVPGAGTELKDGAGGTPGAAGGGSILCG